MNLGIIIVEASLKTLSQREQRIVKVIRDSTLLQITPIPAQLYMGLKKDGKKRM